jgi:hypothetical protein
MTRYEAAALLNACLDQITEVTDELKRLMAAIGKELAVPEAIHFSLHQPQCLPAAVPLDLFFLVARTDSFPLPVGLPLGSRPRGLFWCSGPVEHSVRGGFDPGSLPPLIFFIAASTSVRGGIRRPPDPSCQLQYRPV